MVAHKRAYILLPFIGTLIVVLSLVSAPVFWYMRLAVTLSGATMIGMGLVLILKK